MFIQYKKSTASTQQVLEHLKKCKDNFVPGLDKKVDIDVYAKKIMEHAITFEAWDANELIALIAAYFNDKKNNLAFITSVSTMKNYEKMGIASKLLETCIKYAEENRFKEINLQVSRDNMSAIRLYSKFGFIQKENEEGELLMQKKITTISY